MTKGKTRPKTRRGLRSLIFWRRSKTKKTAQEDQPPKTQTVTAPEENSDSLTCPVCLETALIENCVGTGHCEHRACVICLSRYFSQEINEARTCLTCPESGCSAAFNPPTIQRVLADDPSSFRKYIDFSLRRVLAKAEPDLRHCPAPDCDYAVIASNCAGCPRLLCQRPGCETAFCYHCKLEWHPDITCDENRRRKGDVAAGTVTEIGGGLEERVGVVGGGAEVMRPCPRCKTLISKALDGSCNHMTCAVCGAEFCWLCMKEISDLHYLSPSGCTFWGKKPWSRKKRILSQLATLVGAPAGIALLAAIAGPALIIGLPAYFGHRAYERKYKSVHKRNLAVVGAVGLSVVASPLLAAVAVSVGIPILFGYVYGVVPVALCRSGAVRASANGIHLDFDVEDGPVPYFGGRRLSINSVLMSGGGSGTTAAQVHREAAV